MQRRIRAAGYVLVLIPAIGLAADAPTSQSLEQRAEDWLKQATISAPPESLKLDPFYKKYVPVFEIPIVASEKAHDAALLEVGYLVNMMLGNRPDICKAMVRSNTRLAVIAHAEFTTDLPEFADMTPKDWWDRRARGMGAQPERPVMTSGEENLLALEGDPYKTEGIFVHEFAHAIQDVGLAFVDPDFNKRLTAAYDNAKSLGKWKGKYAMNNIHEYWAEAVQSYFGTNREHDHDHNHVNTRTELAEYDPPLYELVHSALGPNDWQYTSPRDRAEMPHLARLDRGTLPRFKWPERLAKEAQALEDLKRRKLLEAGEQAAPKAQ